MNKLFVAVFVVAISASYGFFIDNVSMNFFLKSFDMRHSIFVE